MKTGGVALALLSLLSQARAEDRAFHISEVIVEDEVRPRQAHHAVHWEGDFYVSDAGVTASGWGRKPGDIKTVPFDRPTASINRWGSALTTTYHRTELGLDVRVEYRSFVVETHITANGPQTCSVTTTTALKPGHDLFEVHRTSNNEPMFDVRRAIIDARCRPPALSS